MKLNKRNKLSKSKRNKSNCIRKINKNKRIVKNNRKSKRTVSRICKKTTNKRISCKSSKKCTRGPKRPRNAYIIFFNKLYKKELKCGQIQSVTQFGKCAGELWRNMEPAEKKHYQERAAKDLLRYNKSMKRYI